MGAAKRRFCLILVKPSHYDDDGYVIQWYRSAIPSNTLASLHGLAMDCADRKVLGDDVEIEIHAHDECNTLIKPEKLAKRIQDAGAGLVMLVGVQSNQFPRALDIARPLKALGIQVAIGGFHVSGTISMLSGKDAYMDQARAMGLSLFAGESEGRLEMVLRDAFNQDLKPLYNFMADLPSARGHAHPVPRRQQGGAHRRRRNQLRRRARLSLSVLVLHHHQRAGAQVAAPLAGRRREDRARQRVARRPQLLHHRRQLRAQQGLGGDPRPPDLLARGGEDADRHHHPGRHAVPQAAEFRGEGGARRRQARLHRAGEHQSRQPDGRQEAAEQDHRIQEDAAGLEERARPDLCRLHHRFPERYARIGDERHRGDQARAAGRPAGVLLPDAAAWFGRSPEAASRRRGDGSRPQQIRPQPPDHGAFQDEPGRVAGGL